MMNMFYILNISYYDSLKINNISKLSPYLDFIKRYLRKLIQQKKVKPKLGVNINESIFKT